MKEALCKLPYVQLLRFKNFKNCSNSNSKIMITKNYEHLLRSMQQKKTRSKFIVVIVHVNFYNISIIVNLTSCFVFVKLSLTVFSADVVILNGRTGHLMQ